MKIGQKSVVVAVMLSIFAGVSMAAYYETLDLNVVSIKGTNMYATAEQLNQAGTAFDSTGAVTIGIVTLTNIHASASNSTVVIRWPANQATTMGTLVLRSLGATNILANGQKIRLVGLRNLNNTSVGEIIDYAGIDYRIVGITSNSEASAIDFWLQSSGAETQIASMSSTGLLVRGSIESSGALDVNASGDVSGNLIVGSNVAAKTLNTTGAGIIGGATTLSNTLTVAGALDLNAAADISGNLVVASNNASATLNTTGAGIIGGNLTVTGTVTEADSLDVNASADVSGNLVVGTNIASATLNTTGAGIIGGALTVTGNVAKVFTLGNRYPTYGPNSSTNLVWDYGSFTNGQATVTFNRAFLGSPIVFPRWSDAIHPTLIASNVHIGYTATSNTFTPSHLVAVPMLTNANYIAIGEGF